MRSDARRCVFMRRARVRTSTRGSAHGGIQIGVTMRTGAAIGIAATAPGIDVAVSGGSGVHPAVDVSGRGGWATGSSRHNEPAVFAPWLAC